MPKPPLKSLLYRRFWSALDWVYPPICAGCGSPGYRLCRDCIRKIQLLSGAVCQICGEPIRNDQAICAACRETPPPFDASRSAAVYQDVVRKSIHALKYHRNLGLGDLYAPLLSHVVRQNEWVLDLILSVPLSPSRERERGYNQSALLARPLALDLDVPYHPFGLNRIRDTQSQVSLSGIERRQNVAGAFSAERAIVTEKRVLVIDDVTTTGATLRACAAALRSADARAIFCLTLARPVLDEPIGPVLTASSII